ncbi:hypothetical protein FQZ97_996460 [compost metagenome]
MVHLLRGALEQAAAAGGEQGIATEQQRALGIPVVVGDMAQGMAGDLEYLELESQDAHHIAVHQGLVTGGDRFPLRAKHPGAAGRFQLGDTADMVAMVVGDQDVGQRPVGMGLQPGQHRRGVTGVDHRAAAGCGVLQQPEVVVGKGGKRVDLDHEGSRQAESNGAS